MTHILAHDPGSKAFGVCTWEQGHVVIEQHQLRKGDDWETRLRTQRRILRERSCGTFCAERQEVFGKHDKAPANRVMRQVAAQWIAAGAVDWENMTIYRACQWNVKGEGKERARELLREHGLDPKVLGDDALSALGILLHHLKRTERQVESMEVRDAP